MCGKNIPSLSLKFEANEGAHTFLDNNCAACARIAIIANQKKKMRNHAIEIDSDAYSMEIAEIISTEIGNRTI